MCYCWFFTTWRGICYRHVSACLSVKSRHCAKMAKCRIMQTTGVTPTAAPNTGGVCSDQRFSTNMSLYLRNGAR